MKILVVGKDGQVGRYLEQMLDTSGNEVLFLGREDLDISLKSEVNSTVISFMPNLIVNAAAYTNVENAESDSASAFQVNDLGVANLVSVCERVKASLIHISTDYVFDGKSKRPYTTQDITNPKNAYGKSKVAGENRIIESDISYYILRTSWVFSEYNSNFVKTMLRKGMEQSLLNVVSDQVGNPTYAGDVAIAICLMIPRLVAVRSQKIYHFGGTPCCSWYEFAETIFDIAVNKSMLTSKPKINMINTRDYESLVDRPLFTALDSKSFQKDFDFTIPKWKCSLENLLDRMR